MVRFCSLFNAEERTVTFLNGQTHPLSTLRALGMGSLLDAMFDFSNKLGSLGLEPDEMALFMAVVLVSAGERERHIQVLQNTENCFFRKIVLYHFCQSLIGIYSASQIALASRTCKLWSSCRRVSSVPFDHWSLAAAQTTLHSSQSCSCACQTCELSIICILTNSWPFASTHEHAHRGTVFERKHLKKQQHRDCFWNIWKYAYKHANLIFKGQDFL